MTDKARWNDPANDGQVNYLKVGARMFAIIMILMLGAIFRIGMQNGWLDTFRSITGL